jgi:FkbM family methyltransferase
MFIYDENDNNVDINSFEKWEQDLAKLYILPNDVVLELGARYGSVSCVINHKLQDKNNQVVVEPDSRVWNALEKNREINGCNFNIVKGFVSNKKLDLTNCDDYFGYGTTSFENEYTKIPSYSLDEIKCKYNLHFNVLVADCEGFLETFFDENPNFCDSLRLVIFEADYSEKCNYDKIKNELTCKGFKKIIEGHQNVWIKKPNIVYNLIHCVEHTERDYYIDIIRDWLGRPIELCKGVYTKNVPLSEQLEYMKSFNKKFDYNENHNFRFYYSGQVGCYLSHYKIVENILNDTNNNLFTDDYTVILEDDIGFLREFHDQIENIILNMNNNSIDFDLIYLGNNNSNHGTHIVDNIYKLDPQIPCWGTHGMLIKNKNVETIYNSILKIKDEIDCHYYKSINENSINGYVVYPSICFQQNFVSNIKL